MYAYGAQSVKCAMCNNVTQVPPVRLQNAQAAAATTAASSTSPAPTSTPPPTAKTTVVVENPPSLDDEGNEVQNIAVGVKTETNAGG